MRGEIVARDVWKSYQTRRGPLPVIEAIDLHVAPGEIIALVGPSGCGKSTLLNLLAGFDKAERGQITIDGQPAGRPNRRRILIPQQPSVFPWMTVRRNLDLVQNGAPRAERNRRTDHYLDLVGLAAFADAFPWQLSGGMRQRVELARALVVRPEILYMDEPFGALDALTRLQIRAEFIRIMLLERHTTILVTHDVEEALFLADRILVLSDRPARIRSIVEVPFPHPRAHIPHEIADLKERILQELGVGVDGPAASLRSNGHAPQSHSPFTARAPRPEPA